MIKRREQERQDKHYLLLFVCLYGSVNTDYRSELIRIRACVRVCVCVRQSNRKPQTALSLFSVRVLTKTVFCQLNVISIKSLTVRDY